SQLESRCPRRFQAFLALAVFSVIGMAAVLRLEAQDVPKAQPPAATQTTKTVTCSGQVVAAGTNKPINGAPGILRRMLSGDLRYPPRKVLEETTHGTDAAGRYSFTLPPDQLAERSLYLEFDVSHPDYAPRNGNGYAWSMIRKNEKLGGRPFFAVTK